MYKKRVVLSVLFIAGIVALLNPLFLAPENLDGSATEVTYTLSEVETEAEARQALLESETTLLCGTGGERPCVLEQQVAAQGELEFAGTLSDDQASMIDPSQRQNARYAVVQLSDEYVIPESERTENGTLLTHRPVSKTEALEHTALQENQITPEIEEAIETGSVTVYDSQIAALEQNYPISYAGSVYRVDSIQYDNTDNPELLFIRMSLFIVGIILVSLAWMWNQ